MSKRTSKWPSTYVSIVVCSRPQCGAGVAEGATTTVAVGGAGDSSSPQNPATLLASAPTPAILDVAENARAKIHALSQRTGFETNAEHSTITVEDRVTLTIIRHYVEFKVALLRCVQCSVYIE